MQLANFFNYTRKFVGLDTISLAEELAQLQRYLTFQHLGLGDKLQDQLTIPTELLGVQMLPGCLLTLVENALKHGFKGRATPYKLEVGANVQDGMLILCVSDNGRGISPGRLVALGHQPVHSDNKGGKVALHQLRQSLRLVFGEQAQLQVASQPRQGAAVSLKHSIKGGCVEKNACHHH